MRGPLKESAEYALSLMLLKAFGWLPRPLAFAASRIVTSTGYRFAHRQRRAAEQNLALAFPGITGPERDRIVRDVFANLGRLLVEFSHFPRLNPDNVRNLVVYEGLNHYLQSVARGRGTIVLTGHIGAWELSVFAHSVFGHPMHFLSRTIDNRRVNRLIQSYRTRYGNVPIDKKGAVRATLQVLRANGVVGVLADQNTVREEAVFVPFLGISAATTKGVAMLAQRTGASVVPGYLVWDPIRKVHRLCFEPAVELQESGDVDADVLENTTRFNAVLGRVIREHPGQWLWIHRRFKTRPEGEPPLYQ